MLKRTGATVWAQAILYKEEVYIILLYGSEIWVVMGVMLKVMEGFYHWVAIRISDNIDRRTMDGECEWPPVEDALEISGLWPIKEYIQRRQSTITEHIVCRPIYELCMGAEKTTGYGQSMRWWYQGVVQEVE